MNNGTANQALRYRKAELQAKIRQTRSIIRQDIQDLKDDLNPFKAAGHMVKNMLKPSPDGQMTNSGVLNFGLDTGISMLVNRILPGGRNVAKVIAPMLLKNLATHVIPKARDKAEEFLRWVAERTDEEPEPYTPVKKFKKNKNLAKKTATKFLRWVAEKTEKKADELEYGENALHQASNGKVKTYYGPVSG